MRWKGVPSLSILEYVGTLATFPLLCTRCFPDVLDMPSLGDNVYAMMGLRPRGSVYRNCLFMLVYLKTVLYPKLAVITPSFVLLLTLTN